MIAFKEDDIIGSDAKLATLENTLATGKIEARKLYLLTSKQSVHLAVEESRIDSLDALEVVLPVGILRRIDAVDEVVVGAYRMRP